MDGSVNPTKVVSARESPIREGSRVSISSTAFGPLVLTGADAVKFKKQVTYGRPKTAARRNVVEGVKLSKALAKVGSIKLRLNGPACSLGGERPSNQHHAAADTPCPA